MSSAALAPPASRSCPLCGGGLAMLHPALPAGTGAAPEPYQIARMSYGTPFEVVRCAGCGLGQALVPWAEPEVLAVYQQGEDPLYTEEERARRATFRRGLELLRQHLAPGPPAPRLLDVGAASGFLVAEARELGFDAVGLEPSRWAAEQARRRFGIEIVEGSLGNANLPAASFDAVTMVDVIEHLPYPFAALEQVRARLRPGGALYLVTPDLSSRLARLLGRRWWGFEPWHLWYFTAPSLHRALRAAGFEVRAQRSYGRTFSLGYWLAKGGGLLGPLLRPVAWAARATGLAARPVTVDLRDTLEFVAVRSDR